MVKAILFDFDNTIANTESIREIRETAAYELLNAETLAKVRAYKPVPGLLKTIRDAGVKLGIVTNSGRGYIGPVLEHLGLQDAFDTIVTYTDVKREGMKPSPKGLKIALEKLGLEPSWDILYVGDENHDHEAAYKAGITPVMPSWATKKPVSMAPALEMSSAQLVDYLANPGEYKLFAERGAELQVGVFKRKAVYFLPLDDSANVVTMKEEMTAFCLGRYFSQKAAVTAWLHEKHHLSKEIQRKEEVERFDIPGHWVEMFAHAIRHGAPFAFDSDQSHFDVVTVIPGKQGKDPRLERLLGLVEAHMAADAHRPVFVPDLFYFVADAQSQKLLRRQERAFEARRALQLNTDRSQAIVGKRVLVIDDVTTTGATMERARSLAQGAGATSVLGLALAKTVSIMADERPCPECDRPMKVRRSRSGEHFWGCTGFQSAINPCKHTESLLKKECPRCGRAMRMNTNKTSGVKFWGCSGWNQTPSCNYTMDVEKSEMPD